MGAMKKKKKNQDKQLANATRASKEFVDAKEEGTNYSENPIQYAIPEPSDNQGFWVILAHLPSPYRRLDRICTFVFVFVFFLSHRIIACRDESKSDV